MFNLRLFLLRWNKREFLPLQAKYRLKKRNEFRLVFQKGRPYANRQFVLVCIQSKKGWTFSSWDLDQSKSW